MKHPAWLDQIIARMQERGLNPYALSVRAGLNDTAVRDLLAGRVKSPRYDTLQAIAEVLDTTPAALMGERQTGRRFPPAPAVLQDLLSLIVAEVIRESDAMGLKLKPERLGKISAQVLNQMMTHHGEQITKKEIFKEVKATLTQERQKNLVKKRSK